jgi:hypothetical protein
MLGYFVALEERVMSRDACFFQADARRLAAFLDPRLRETCRQRLAEADAALADAEARCVAEVGREARLFRKWVRIAETLETMPSPGPLTARPFPGWERALAPHESSADAVPLTTRAYLIPSEKGRTDLRVYADGDAVCFAFECFEPAMDRLSVRTREDSLNVYGDDGVEIFLAAQQGTPRCAHFLANADGFKIASDCDIPGRRWNWAWHPRWEVRARRHPDRWTLVARISLADVGGAAEVFFTVVRNRVVGGLLDISGFPDGGAFFNTAAYHPLRIGPATAP